VALPSGQALHLATYLALGDKGVPRDELASLFWPEAEARRARHNLSQLLYSLRRTAWAHDVEADGRRLRWQPGCDVQAFRRAVGDGDWERAAALYGGELLQGMDVPASGAFESWLSTEREELASSWREAALGHAAALRRDGRCSEAIPLLRRLLRTDDLLEDAVDLLVRCEAELGRRDAALRVFDRFRERLRGALGLEPLASTAELAERLRSVDDAPPADAPADQAPVTTAGRPGPGASRVRNLPDDGTAFVGRVEELADLHALADLDGHRALTIVGPGGAGKTRLARRLVRERAAGFRDGAVWVPLDTVHDEAGVLRAVATAAAVQADPTPAGLTAALAEHDLLLALDNVEHLDCAPAVASALLDGCPGLRLVLTSRAPIDVPGEVVYRLRALRLPQRDDAEDAESFDAVALFVRSARRARPDFHPAGEEHRAMVALIRELAGSPLALELAASWMGLLEPSELLREVRRDLDVLKADRDDMPRRQRSLRAVFESSWSLLGIAEQGALLRLAVFRGGCTRESAMAVADVPLGTLLALTNRSLLQRAAGGRFLAHPTVQRFGRQRLERDPALLSELDRRHGEYFLALAQRADRQLDTHEQPAALRALDADRDDLTRALERHLAGGRHASANALAAALGRYWVWRGHTHEALGWFARLRGLQAADGPTPERAAALRAEGAALAAAGRYEEAQRSFGASLAAARALGNPSLAAAAQRERATVAWRHGDLKQAAALLEEAAAGYRALGDRAALAGVLGNLGNVLRDSDDVAAAQARYDEALALAERLGHVWETANVLNNKAIAFVYQDDLDAARRTFERALELRRSIDHRPGILTCLTNLGNVALDTGDWDRAHELYDAALELARELGDREGTTHLLNNLGIVAQWEERFEEAHRFYGEALELRRELGLRGMIPQSLSCFADLAVARGAFASALVLAGAVRSLCARVGVPLTAPQQESYRTMLAAARSAVPAADADALERRGEAMATQDAIAYALVPSPDPVAGVRAGIAGPTSD